MSVQALGSVAAQAVGSPAHSRSRPSQDTASRPGPTRDGHHAPVGPVVGPAAALFCQYLALIFEYDQKIAFPQLREQAIALRRAGKSRREIKDLLAIGSNWTLNEALRGEPPQPWTWRPNAKDPLRDKARDLREQGLNYNQIAAELGVSKSSVSLWVRDLPRPPGLSYEECRKRVAEGVRRYWAAERPIREAEREAVALAAAAEDRRAESSGRSSSPGPSPTGVKAPRLSRTAEGDRVSFINSDPALIRFFLRFLYRWGRARTTDLPHLHSRERRHRIRSAVLAGRHPGRPGQFRSPTLKRHNPATVRKNMGDGYHGCLRIDVRQSVGLYQKIEGWAAAAMAAADGAMRPGRALPYRNLLPGEDSNLGQGHQKSWSCAIRQTQESRLTAYGFGRSRRRYIAARPRFGSWPTWPLRAAGRDR